MLAHYLRDQQLQVFDPDGDNAFFVPNQLLVAGEVARPVRTRLDATAPDGHRGRSDCRGPARRDVPMPGDPERPAPASRARSSTSTPAATWTSPSWPSSSMSNIRARSPPTTSSPGSSGGWGGPTATPSPRPTRFPPCPNPLPGDGGGITVAVIDTGWPSRLPRSIDWFERGCDHSTAPGEVDEAGRALRHIDPLDRDRDGYLDVEAGHALFVAGLVRRMAPRARLVFLKALNSDGVGTELGVARAIRYAVARGVDIINLSLGFYTVRNRTPAGVEAAVAAAEPPAPPWWPRPVTTASTRPASRRRSRG